MRKSFDWNSFSARKVNLDMQLTFMASSLYRLLGSKLGNRYQRAKSWHIFRDFVDVTATLLITKKEIIVKLRKRASNPFLIAADYENVDIRVPWLQGKKPQFIFG